MATSREVPLADPFAARDELVLLDDTRGDLWWIDGDGDLRVWDDPEPPDDPFEVRRSAGFAALDPGDNAAIEAAFAASRPVPEDEWAALFASRAAVADATLEDLKGLALADLDAAIEDVSTAAMTAWVRRLDAELTALARLRGYLEARCGMGHGDRGHAGAVAECNRVTRQVRRALGYYQAVDVKF